MFGARVTWRNVLKQILKAYFFFMPNAISQDISSFFTQFHIKCSFRKDFNPLYYYIKCTFGNKSFFQRNTFFLQYEDSSMDNLVFILLYINTQFEIIQSQIQVNICQKHLQCKYIQQNYSGNWGTRKKCTLYKYLPYTSKCKSVDITVNYFKSVLHLFHCTWSSN